jgi:ectoine hydroxylase-related dioxygenase (phytanoyl-CoA dioxygenase family)
LNHSLDELAEQGYCIVPDVLDERAIFNTKTALSDAAIESERRGTPTYIPGLDPNESNVRVFNLLDLDNVFQELILHKTALKLVKGLIGEGFLISNFTANIARPGSKSMAIHSDQGIVIPEPWLQPWSVNIIWCLDDIFAENGATLYLPGSHKIKRAADLPPNIKSQMKSFRAKAGSIIAMDGRMWHTSGANIMDNSERALLFGYYTANFIRPQVNWNALLSAETISALDESLFGYLGLGPAANVGLTAPLVIQP